MRAADDSLVTAERLEDASLGRSSGPAGVWTFDGDAILASDVDGPATVLVPTEGVLLLAVDLPVAGRAKRLAALPFAVEDRIAEPVENVHLALGAELAPKRFLVGVARHDRMAEWISHSEAAGLGDAALVPDALALPIPVEGEWSVDLGTTRAVVRAGDGSGFAIPAPMLETAWTAAGQPRIISYGAPLPAAMVADADILALDPLARRLIAPALDLRQGRYARRRAAMPGVGKRLAQLAAIGILAHTGIAAADAIALRGIANDRAEQTRALVQSVAPGAALGEDLPSSVADLLSRSGAGGGGQDALLPVMARVSAALAPVSSAIAFDSIRLDGGVATIDVAAGDPALPGRIRGALADAGVDATVAATDTGTRISVNAQ